MRMPTRLHVTWHNQQGNNVERKIARVQNQKIEQEEILYSQDEISERHWNWTSAIT